MIPHRVFVTGIQPTGMMHIGNYFGFIEQWLDLQRVDDSTPLILSIVDLHAITTGLLSADQLRSNTRTMVASLLACGIDPNRTILFRQSDVPEHTQLAWLLAALCTTSQLQRMPQFREKSQSYRHGNIPVCLLTYPVLQAADILLYRGTHVPVGDDQTTHMQMSADIATHFNNFYQCQYFPIPIQVKSPNERIKSLRDAQKKMSKSDLDCKSRIEICDPTDVIMEKCKKALTDCGSSTIGNDNRPAVNNLFQLYAAASRLPLAIVVDRFRNSTMSQFKPQLAYEIDARFAPIRVEFDRLMHRMPSDYLTNILNDGATKARQIAVENMRKIRSISGFL